MAFLTERNRSFYLRVTTKANFEADLGHRDYMRQMRQREQPLPRALQEKGQKAKRKKKKKNNNEIENGRRREQKNHSHFIVICISIRPEYQGCSQVFEISSIESGHEPVTVQHKVSAGNVRIRRANSFQVHERPRFKNPATSSYEASFGPVG